MGTDFLQRDHGVDQEVGNGCTEEIREASVDDDLLQYMSGPEDSLRVREVCLPMLVDLFGNAICDTILVGDATCIDFANHSPVFQTQVAFDLDFKIAEHIVGQVRNHAH